MVRSEFRFNLWSFVEYQQTTDPGWKEWAEQVTAAVAPYIDRDWGEGDDFSIFLDSPKLTGLVQVIERLQRHKIAKPGSVSLKEWLVDDARSIEWFELNWDEHELEIGPGVSHAMLQVKADRMKPGLHVARGETGCAVSEKFKAVVEKNGLTGLDFFWLQDAGKNHAPQWFTALPRQSLGRGIDHPWFDRGKLKRHPAWQSHEAATWHFGVRWFFRETFKDRPPFRDASVTRLFHLFRKSHICVTSFRRVLRQYLPKAEFAFCGAGNERWDKYRGKQYRISRRGFCASRRARDLLIAAKVTREGDWVGVLVLDQRPEGAQVLDDLFPEPPEPVFTNDELRQIRAEEARAWEAFVASPKPARNPDLARSLTLLKARKRSAPKSFAKGASNKAIERLNAALPRPLPLAWEKVLRITNGGVIEESELADGEACAIPSTEELPEFHQEQHAIARDFNPGFSGTYLHVVHSMIGDYICLDTSRQTPQGECPVLLISHETGQVDREWDRVASFLEELLES